MFEAAPTATGNPSVIDLAAAGQLPSARATQAFDVAALAFCAALSRLFLAYEGPGVEVVRALGFWLRPAGLQALQARYPQARQGIGRVFHVPPSNVPTLLVYSWLTSVLAGNDNLVRLSAARSTPLEDTLLVEAKVSPKDIAFLRPGLEAVVKITAYDFTIYGGLHGKVEQISADSIQDEEGNSFYLVRVRTEKSYLGDELNALPIIPGMLASADIITGKKSVLDYLLKPILRAKQSALRER